MVIFKYLTFAVCFWTAFAVTLFILSGCTDIDKVVITSDEPLDSGIHTVDYAVLVNSEWYRGSQDINVRLPYNADARWEAGAKEAVKFIRHWEFVFGTWGGDESLHAFDAAFRLPTHLAGYKQVSVYDEATNKTVIAKTYVDLMVICNDYQRGALAVCRITMQGMSLEEVEAQYEL